MKAAIPTFGDRVSPRFDCAAGFLVVTLQEDAITDRVELNAGDWAPHQRINRLLDLAVDVVICGGIDRWSAESLNAVGITVHGWVTGSIDENLAALQRGEFPTNVAGFGGTCRGRGCGHGRGRRRSGRSQPPQS